MMFNMSTFNLNLKLSAPLVGAPVDQDLHAHREVTRLRKAGALQEALTLARELTRGAPQDRFVTSAHGWVIWELLKRLKEGYEAQRLPAAQAHAELYALLREYATLGVRGPDLLHSQILSVTLHFKEWGRALWFYRWWLEQGGLSTGDHERFTPEGSKRALPSLAERLWIAVARTLADGAERQQLEPALMEWAGARVQEALSAAPNSEYLNYFWAKYLLAQGRVEEAREFARVTLRRQQRAMWAWATFAETLPAGDLEGRVVCWRYAIALERNPSLSLRVQERLMEALLTLGRTDEAAGALRGLIAVRQREGYKLSPRLRSLAQEAWFTSALLAAPALEDAPLTPNALTALSEEALRLAGVERAAPRVSRAGQGRHRGAEGASEGEREGARAVRGCLSQPEGRPFGFLTPALKGEEIDRDVWVPPALMSAAPPREAWGDVAALAVLGERPSGGVSWRVVRWA